MASILKLLGSVSHEGLGGYQSSGPCAFFHHPRRLLTARGHEVLVTSRDKDVAIDLLRELDVEHRPLSVPGRGLVGFARELAQQDFALWRVVRKFRPEVMAEIGGTFVGMGGVRSSISRFRSTLEATIRAILRRI